MNLIKHIPFNNQELPLAFNMASFLKFCKITGIKSVSQAQEVAMNAASNLDDPENLELACKMYWCGFEEGHRLTGKSFTLNVEDLMDWNLIIQVGKAFSDSTTPEYSTTETESKQSNEASPNA